MSNCKHFSPDGHCLVCEEEEAERLLLIEIERRKALWSPARKVSARLEQKLQALCVPHGKVFYDGDRGEIAHFYTEKRTLRINENGDINQGIADPAFHLALDHRNHARAISHVGWLRRCGFKDSAREWIGHARDHRRSPYYGGRSA